jgi:hypothetical protein
MTMSIGSGGRCLLAIASLALAAAAQADILVYTATLDGPSESPPNNSPGTGSATVTLDTAAHTMRVQASFTGLLGTTTASHIHAPTTVPLTGTAGVATQTPTFAGFPLGVTAGSYDNTFNMLDAASYNPAFVSANGGTPASAEAALFAAIGQGRAYLNIHSSQFSGGEIRGFLIPAPGAVGAFVLAGLAACRRRRG